MKRAATRITANDPAAPRADAAIMPAFPRLPKSLRKLPPVFCCANARTTTATPNPAPELTPRIEGSANGLRNKVCISKPLTANAAPASAAVQAFGKRKSQIISAEASSDGIFPVSAAATSASGSVTEPNAISRQKTVNKAMISRRYFIVVVDNRRMRDPA